MLMVSRPSRTLRAVQGIAACALLVVLPFGCSAQSEGDRCNAENGNDDCQEGLVCKTSRELEGNADICCPETGSSESPECTPGGGTGGSGGSGSGASGSGAGPGSSGSGASGSGASGSGASGGGGNGTGAGGGGSTGGSGGTGGA